MFSTETWQMRPRPPVFATPLLHVVVAPIVAAAAGAGTARNVADPRANANTAEIRRDIG